MAKLVPQCGDNIINPIVKAYAFNLVYAQKLVEDLSSEQMCAVPGAGHENHPAFTLGHLCTGAAMVANDLGIACELPEGWVDLFQRRGPNDRRLPEPTEYPKKELLLVELERLHGLAVEGLRRAKTESFANQCNWRLGRWLPTELDAHLFMFIGHELMHLGQLAAWRRAMGLPAAMAALPT